MAATAAQIARLRRMVNETTEEPYSDDDIQAYIEIYPLEDLRGEGPWIESTSTPGQLVENPDWAPTYDLNAAAADLWAEKAGILAADFDFNADGGQYSRSQAYEQAMKQARYFRSRRAPKTITLRPEPLAQGSETVES